MTHASTNGHEHPVSESSHNTDSHTPNNPFKSRDSMDSDTHDEASQLSPRFLEYLREKTTKDGVHEITTTEITHSTSVRNPDRTFDSFDSEATAVAMSGAPDKLRGIKIAHTISPVDGKTEGCDRRHTFDNFVNQQQIRSEWEPAKKIGHGRQVLRALKKAVGSKKSRATPLTPRVST